MSNDCDETEYKQKYISQDLEIDGSLGREGCYIEINSLVEIDSYCSREADDSGTKVDTSMDQENYYKMLEISEFIDSDTVISSSAVETWNKRFRRS